MKMFIGNCTQQVQEFLYRIPENPKQMVATIDIGRQYQVPIDLNQLQIDAIVEQHSQYGFVRVNEINRTKAFFGLCYDIDREISNDALRTGVFHTHDVLTEWGKETREHCAVAIDHILTQQDGDFRKVEVSVTEYAPKGQDATLNETITVDRNAPAQKRSPGRPRARS